MEGFFVGFWRISRMDRFVFFDLFAVAFFIVFSFPKNQKFQSPSLLPDAG
jgi:hypothetical protein